MNNTIANIKVLAEWLRLHPQSLYNILARKRNIGGGTLKELVRRTGISADVWLFANREDLLNRLTEAYKADH